VLAKLPVSFAMKVISFQIQLGGTREQRPGQLSARWR
jgi:hypothetical protein